VSIINQKKKGVNWTGVPERKGEKGGSLDDHASPEGWPRALLQNPHHSVEGKRKKNFLQPHPRREDGGGEAKKKP